MSQRGEAREWTLNPLWTRIDLETHEEFGLLRLFLVSRGWRLAVAAFWSEREESFAKRLRRLSLSQTRADEDGDS